MNQYEKIAAINVNEHVEKKNNLSYLSWAWAVDQLLRLDPNAAWEYRPEQKYGDTMMVFCSVTAFGKTMTAQLPVMDHRNKAIPNPDAFQVNTAMQRCLAKAIALHGLGLYIYAGEDLPGAVQTIPEKLTDEEAQYEYDAWIQFKASVEQDADKVAAAWKEKPSNVRSAIKRIGDSLQQEQK